MTARFLGFSPKDINEQYPRVAQIQSHLSFYLKARVPPLPDIADLPKDWHPFAAGIAPPWPNSESSGMSAAPSMLSARFIDWLFGKKGPFRWDAAERRADSDFDVVAELRKMRKRELDKEAYMSGEDDEFDDESLYALDSDDDDDPDRWQAAPNWRLLPDALLLAHFFIRTTQLDLLERTLVHLQSALPTLATASAPVSVWSFCMLDNRTLLRYSLSELASPSEEPSITYPTFLCLLALFDWSKPALDVILRVFSDSTHMWTVISWIHSSLPAFSCMLDTLDLVTSPPSTSARVLEILDLFHQYDVPIDLEYFKGISPSITSSYRIFYDVLVHYDLPNVPRSLDPCRQSWIGKAMVDWVCKGHIELVDVALEHEYLLDADIVQRLCTFAAERGDWGLVAKLAALEIYY
ncbi:hypothetical protein BCR44DRAFT_40121 [Catenaria anguillulae PL171]|uniref:Uncharacterized protein n=1 Tax=Catenaria anguillulae PL171 TaxID=765915 RepID=A0A1Y2HLU2_9FUNG|nr:hypothetical protein BCR44DRAFT_40121 [Catenaria anguillulae PL171]